MFCGGYLLLLDWCYCLLWYCLFSPRMVVDICLVCLSLSARFISHGIVFFSYNKTSLAVLSAAETISRIANHNYCPWFVCSVAGAKWKFFFFFLYLKGWNSLFWLLTYGAIVVYYHDYVHILYLTIWHRLCLARLWWSTFCGKVVPNTLEWVNSRWSGAVWGHKSKLPALRS